MSTLRWVSVLGLLATASCVSGPNIYDVCRSTQECPGTTTCQVANTTTDGFQGTFCTYSCVLDTDCPGDGYAPPICEAGQCYAGCPGGSGCPYNEVCGTDGQVFFCVP